jgi:hypothetical protein
MNRRPPPGDHPDHHRDPDRQPDRPNAVPDSATAEGPVQTVKLRSGGDLITAAGYMLGYTPTEPSLLIVGVTDRRVVVLARADLPDPADLPAQDGLTGAWEMFTRPLVNADAEAVAVIAYADRGWDPLLRGFTEAAPLPVLDLLRVHAGRWWSLDCPHPDRCDHPSCTPDGAPLEENLTVTAPLVAGGAAAPGSRDDLTAGLRPGPAEVIEQVAAHLRIQPARSRETLYQAVCEAHDARAGGPDPIPPGQAAVLLTALADVHVRDACLAWTDTAAWWLFRDLIAAAPPGYVAPVATAIAVLAYQRGDGVMASIATDHALTDAPGYGLARLIQASLHHAVPPEAISTLIAEALDAHPLTALTRTRPIAPTAASPKSAQTQATADQSTPDDLTQPERNRE